MPVEKHHVWGDILNLAFEEKVEEKTSATNLQFVINPVEVSPLTKRKADRPELVERFELLLHAANLQMHIQN